MPNCQHCGKEGAIPLTGWIGGQGYVPGYFCQDTYACWERWDKANGIVAPYPPMTRRGTWCEKINRTCIEGDCKECEAVGHHRKEMKCR